MYHIFCRVQKRHNYCVTFYQDIVHGVNLLILHNIYQPKIKDSCLLLIVVVDSVPHLFAVFIPANIPLPALSVE